MLSGPAGDVITWSDRVTVRRRPVASVRADRGAVLVAEDLRMPSTSHAHLLTPQWIRPETSADR